MFDFKTGKGHNHGATIGLLFIFPSTLFIIPIIYFISTDLSDILFYIFFPSGIIIGSYMLFRTYQVFVKCPKCQVLGIKKSFFNFSFGENPGK